jgi:hypothetical protein
MFIHFKGFPIDIKEFPRDAERFLQAYLIA